MTNWITNMYRAFDERREECERAQKEFNEKLGEPDLFIPDPNGPNSDFGIGTGYWRVPEGILSVERMGDFGYDPSSRKLWNEDWVQQITALLDKQPRQF